MLGLSSSPPLLLSSSGEEWSRGTEQSSEGEGVLGQAGKKQADVRTAPVWFAGLSLTADGPYGSPSGPQRERERERERERKKGVGGEAQQRQSPHLPLHKFTRWKCLAQGLRCVHSGPQ